MLILSFAIWGIGDIFLGDKDGEAVISVGDIEYNSSDLLKEYDRTRKAMRLPPEYEAELKSQIMDSVTESMVNNGLLAAESSKLKLVFGDNQLKDWVGKSDRFRNDDGKFNPDLLRQALFNSGLNETDFFALLREDMKRNQLVSAVVGNISPPTILIEKLYNYRNEKRTVNVVEIKAKSILNISTPQESELKQLYKATQKNYMAPDYRTVTFVDITPKEVAKDITIPKNELREEYQVRINELTKPALRDLQQVIFATKDAALKAVNAAPTSSSKTKMNNYIQSLGRTANIIELKAVLETELLDDEERKAAFKTPLGNVSSPVKTAFGWKVFFPQNEKPKQVISFEVASKKIKDDLAQEKALDVIFELTNIFEDALASGSTLFEAANEINFKPQVAKLIAKNGLDEDGNPITGVPSERKFLRTVFSTPIGEQSQLIESKDGGYFLIQVDSEKKARQKHFEEVKVEVKKNWETNERKRLIKIKANELVEKSKFGKGLANKARELGYTIVKVGPFTRFGQGMENNTYVNELAPIAFELEKDGVTLTETKNTVLAVELINIQSARPDKQSAEWLALKKELINALEQDYLVSLRKALRNEFNIYVNQSYIQTLVTSE